MLYKKILPLKFLIIIIIIILFALSCSNRNQKVIAKIDNIIITGKDIQYKQAIDSCYTFASSDSFQKQDDLVALIQLIDAAFYDAILSREGLEIDNPTIVQKSQWIDKNTKDPQKLMFIKDVFGKDIKSYNWIFIKPILTNQLLHYYVSNDTIIQKEKIAIIKKIYNDIENKVSRFEKYKNDTVYYKGFYPKESTNSAILDEFTDNNSDDEFVNKIIKTTKYGQIYNEIYEDNYSYQIIKVLGENDSSYIYDAIIIRKTAFDGWFKNYVTKLSIEVDKDYSLKLNEKYPSLWWIKFVRN